ncbi:hypothetical protein [Cellulomonas citrea]|uniref:hypothetical protein n=1 Tax=Cellulomonas citrea TaxID=1909423 RepID=UPI00135834E0|nr:hypothetical protein [Cellulomonas citrea]
MGIGGNLQFASIASGMGTLQRQAQDLQRGLGVANDTLRALLVEQQRANALAEQQLQVCQEANQHLVYLINALAQAGMIRLAT